MCVYCGALQRIVWGGPDRVEEQSSCSTGESQGALEERGTEPDLLKEKIPGVTSKSALI